MIRIATRRSPLARWQAEWVATALRELGHEVALVPLTSEGDTHSQVIDGKQSVGLFTKRIQQAVLENEADIAVHSLKDLPTQVDTGLVLAAVPARASVADCLITPNGISFDELPRGARLGTGSRRRAAQLLHQRPDLQLEPIRGNVRTRLDQIEQANLDGVVLAEAGLRRLGMEELASQPLPLDWMLPAAGQGALGIEARPNDAEALAALANLNSPETMACVTAERALLRQLKAGCLAPVGVHVARVQQKIHLRAAVLSVDGAERIACELSRPWHPEDLAGAEDLGIHAAEELIAQGAAPLIEAAR